eukprot:scaffold1928_cov381-Prasinococcus_capsulatus_cf.AAC.10
MSATASREYGALASTIVLDAPALSRTSTQEPLLATCTWAPQQADVLPGTERSQARLCDAPPETSTDTFVRLCACRTSIADRMAGSIVPGVPGAAAAEAAASLALPWHWAEAGASTGTHVHAHTRWWWRGASDERRGACPSQAHAPRRHGAADTWQVSAARRPGSELGLWLGARCGGQSGVRMCACSRRRGRVLLYVTGAPTRTPGSCSHPAAQQCATRRVGPPEGTAATPLLFGTQPRAASRKPLGRLPLRPAVLPVLHRGVEEDAQQRNGDAHHRLESDRGAEHDDGDHDDEAALHHVAHAIGYRQDPIERVERKLVVEMVAEPGQGHLREEGGCAHMRRGFRDGSRQLRPLDEQAHRRADEEGNECRVGVDRRAVRHAVALHDLHVAHDLLGQHRAQREGHVRKHGRVEPSPCEAEVRSGRHAHSQHDRKQGQDDGQRGCLACGAQAAASRPAASPSVRRCRPDRSGTPRAQPEAHPGSGTGRARQTWAAGS